MTQNINVKKDAKVGLRKAMFPIGIITTILGFVWFIIHASGTSSTDIKFMKDMVEAGRYVAMPFAFLALVLAGLMITHAIMQLTNTNKNNAKWELTSGIINALVGVLLFVFFITVIVNVFSIEKWSYSYYSEEYGIMVLGKKSIMIFTFMGILTSLSLFVAVFGRQFNKASLQGKNTNVKMLRTIGVFALVLALCNIIVVAMTLMGGFIDPEKIEKEEEYVQFTTSAYTAKFALAAIGTLSFAILSMIPLTIFGINDKAQAKKQIIMWSVLGAVIFVLFVVGAALMTVKDAGQSYYYPKNWEDDHTSASVMVLLGEIVGIVAGSLAIAKTKPRIA